MMNPHATKVRARSRRPDPRREGVVMLIVMLIILMATATAFFAVHATAFEIRASGNVRQSMQTEYVAETGATSAMALVDMEGPVAIQEAMRQTVEANLASGKPILDMSMFGEPNIVQDTATGETKDAYRMTLPQLQTAIGVDPVDRDSLGGAHQAFTPAMYVDIYDVWTYTGSIAGERADGAGRLQYMRATYTSRGRTRIAGGDYKSPSSNAEERDYHEGADDARAHGLSGPYGARVGG